MPIAVRLEKAAAKGLRDELSKKYPDGPGLRVGDA